MKHLLRSLSCLLLTFLLVALVACNAGNDVTAPGTSKESYTAGVNGATLDGGSSPSSGESYEKKIVRTARLNAETKEYDTARTSLSALLTENGAYLSSSSESGSSERQSRVLSLTIRVPAEKLDTFLASVGDLLHLTRSTVESSDITLQYYDTESRLATLRAEKAALDAMLEKATTTADLIAINQRLFDVMEEIDSLQTQMNIYKDKVEDATVYLTVCEVATFSPESESFGSRIKTSFLDGWSGFASFWASFAVWLVGALPTLLVLAALGVGLFFPARALLRRRRAKSSKGGKQAD